MHPKNFIEKLDENEIAAAIRLAEQSTSGEIRVCVSHRHRVDALAAAQRRFRQLGMDRMPRRNAVLIYFAPLAQTFSVWGDIGLDGKCSVESWQAIADTISSHLQAGHFSAAVRDAVRDVGVMLAKHFPRNSSEPNLLSDSVIRD